MRRLVLCAFALYAAALSVASARADTVQPEPLDRFPRTELTIATPDARVHTFKVWVADTEPRREQGLMFIKHLPDDAGMLFVYTAPRQIYMWMKNTFIPLDMIFIRADGKVARVVANAKPQSLKTIASGEEVIGVLELNGGIAARYNIKRGAIVTTPIFGGN